MNSLPADDIPLELPGWLPADLEGEVEPSPPEELRLKLAPRSLAGAARSLRAAGGRFVTMFLAEAPEPALLVVIALAGNLVVLLAPRGAATFSYESLSQSWPAAFWAESELVEREGVQAVGLDNSRRLTEPDADILDRRVNGLDAFAMPYGPIRSGVFEAIQFLIESGGEDVLRLKTRPFFKNRGMERRFEGLVPEQAVYVAERVAGIASVAYAAAFSQAVERALGVQPPRQAERWRAAYAELERLANHLDVMAKEAATAALSVGHARFQILKENVMRLRATLCGSRFGRGVIVPGGVRFKGRVDLDALLKVIDDFEKELRRDRELFLGTASMTDRLIGTGHLDRTIVEDYGAVGPLARGSGVSTDARHERPYGDHKRLGLQIVTARKGDAMARIEVRFGEMSESLRILRLVIDQLRRKDGNLRIDLPAGESGEAFGWAEAPQGELVIWVELSDGLVSRVRIASPSLRNWALFDHAFPTDVLTDFAFNEYSFGLTPAGADR